MKSRLLSLLVLCLFGITLLQAQNDISIDYKVYEAHDSTTRKDVKQLKKTDAIYFEEGNTYQEALPGYLSLYKKTPDFKPLNWRIAMCYLRTEQKEKALTYLLSCDSTMSPLYLFYLAKAYHLNNDFEKAKYYYEDFQRTFAQNYHRLFYSTFEVKKRQYPFDSLMNQLIASCETGLKERSDSLNYTFEKITIINKSSNELSPVLMSDKKLYFASDRPHGKHNTMQVYEIKYDSSEFIGAPKITTRIPYQAHDARIPLYEDTAQQALVYQTMTKGGDLLIATQKKNKVKIKEFKAFNSTSLESTACLLNDSTFVFASTRDKKQDEADLYISLQNDRKKWQKPEKIGGNINTIGREEVLTFYNGELYFISNGPASMGGFDIFKVPYLGANNWGDVENLGSPINTADNDMGYLPIDSCTAFYTGVRPGGEGGTDIYKVIISPLENSMTTADSRDIDTVFMLKMKQDLELLDSLYADPSIVGEYGDYNAKLDSLLNEELLYDTMLSDSTTTIDTIPSPLDSTIKVNTIIITDSIKTNLEKIDSIATDVQEIIDTTQIVIE